MFSVGQGRGVRWVVGREGQGKGHRKSGIVNRDCMCAMKKQITYIGVGSYIFDILPS